MWNTLAAGFSEFASVVQQDATTMMGKINEQAAQLTAALEEEQQQQQQSDSDGDSPRSPISAARRREITTANCVLDQPPGIHPDLVRELQHDKATYLEQVSDSDAGHFLPTWLSPKNDIDAQPEKKLLLELGAMLLRNSAGVMQQFQHAFPDAGDNTLETLQEQKSSSSSSNSSSLTPADFFLRYFIKLNKLAIIVAAAHAASSHSPENPGSRNEAAATILALETRVEQLSEENSRLHREADASKLRTRRLEELVEEQGGKAAEWQARARELEQQVEALRAAAGTAVTAAVTAGGASPEVSASRSSQAAAASPGSPGEDADEKKPAAVSGGSSGVNVDTPDEEDDEGWADVA